MFVSKIKRQDEPDKTQSLLIVFLVIIAGGLRLPKIGIPLYDQEYLTLFWFGEIPWKTLLFEYINGGQHTFVAVLWRITKAIFGENEIAFRSGAWVPGILAIPLLFKIVVLLFRSNSAGFIAGSMLAFSYLHLKWSLIVRGYSPTVFLSLAATYCVIKLIFLRRSVIWGTLLILTGFSLVLTIPINSMFLIGLTMFYLISTWGENKRIKSYFKDICFFI